MHRRATRLRRGQADDAEQAGRICFEAFRAVATAPASRPTSPQRKPRQGFSPICSPTTASTRSPPSNTAASWARTSSTRGPRSRAWDRPQDSGVGKLLMLDVIERARAKEFIGTRLLQAAHHNRACGLYAKLGFDVQEAIVTLQGPPVDKQGSRLQRPRGTRGRLGGDEPRCRRRDCRVHRHVAARGPANVARVRRHNNGLARRCLTKLRIRPGSPAAVRPGLARGCNSTVPQADSPAGAGLSQNREGLSERWATAETCA
jgi:hypothetical protein